MEGESGWRGDKGKGEARVGAGWQGQGGRREGH